MLAGTAGGAAADAEDGPSAGRPSPLGLLSMAGAGVEAAPDPDPNPDPDAAGAARAGAASRSRMAPMSVRCTRRSSPPPGGASEDGCGDRQPLLRPLRSSSVS